MPDVHSVFARLDLSSYIEVFAANGFDTWEDVLDITESDLETLGVRLGHRRRLQREIASHKGVPIEQVIHSPDRAVSLEAHQSVDEDRQQAGGGQSGSGGTGKRRYRRHPKADKNAPERPPSAYVLFSNQIREELKPQNLTFTEIAKLVGERWQQLDSNGREPYESQATAMKDDFNAKLAEYKKTDEYREYAEYLQQFKANQAAPAGSGSDGKRVKLERQGEGSHGSSRGSAGTPSTSAHGSPISVSSSIMHPPLSQEAGNTLSSPTSSIGLPGPVYGPTPIPGRPSLTPPARPPVLGQPPLDHSGLYAGQHSLPPLSTTLPRRTNNPAAPFLHRRDVHEPSSSYSSHHSSMSQGSPGGFTPITPVDPGTYSGSQPQPSEGEQTPTFGQRQGMQNLSIGQTSSVHPPRSAPAAPVAQLPPGQISSAYPRPDAASRMLPLPHLVNSTPQQQQPQQPQQGRMDGLSVLALAGRYIDEDSSAEGKQKPP